MISRPFRRTARQFRDGEYAEGGRWMYLLHPRFAREPRHYVRAFLSLQADFHTLLESVEPADANRTTYSHKIQQLLVRTCIEVEANLTAVLRENGYSRQNLTMTNYRLVNASHRLSSFEVRVPMWRGSAGVRRPFSAWATDTDALTWYQAYNKSKHDRHENFHLATFDALVDAIAGLVVLLSAQFHTEDYSPTAKSLVLSGTYSCDANDGMETAIGDFFRVRMPLDWPEHDRYDFQWDSIAQESDPFSDFDYTRIEQAIPPSSVKPPPPLAPDA